MKTVRKIAFGLSALLLLLVGCTSGVPEDSPDSSLPSSLSSEESPSGASAEKRKLTGGTLVEPIVIPDFTNNNEGELTIIPFPVYNNMAIFEVPKYNVNENGEYLDSANHTYYSYELSTGQINRMGRIDNLHYSPNHLLVMNDQYLYQAVHAGGGLVFCGFSLNGEKEKIIEPGGDETASSSLWSLSKLNNEEIVIHGWDFLPGQEDVAEYYIKKYNVNTGAYIDLIRTSHNRTAREGKDISKVYCNESHIFVLSTFPDRQIEVYDGNGNHIKSYDVGEIDKEIRKVSPTSSDSFESFEVYGNYFVVKTSSGNTFIFRLNDDELERIAVVEDYLSDLCLKSQKGEPEYLISIHDEKFQVFDFKTETVSPFESALDEKCKYFKEIRSDEEGNVMLIISSSKSDYDEEAVVKHFYFSADELRAQFK